jgi:hypothetical protein
VDDEALHELTECDALEPDRRVGGTLFETPIDPAHHTRNRTGRGSLIEHITTKAASLVRNPRSLGYAEKKTR